MDVDDAAPALRRVSARLPAGTMAALDGLSHADLTTVQLDLARRRAARTSTSDLLRRAAEDRFVAPGPVDPRLLWAVENRVWQLIPEQFQGVDLSPLSVLGTCAVTAGVSQGRIVSTVRRTEVSSDPTNALAVVAAQRWRDGDGDDVHVAALQPVVRAQRFGDPKDRAHFRLMALVSVGRDVGSARTEARLLGLHVATWQDVLAVLLPRGGARVTVTPWGDGAVRERLVDTVLPAAAAGRVPVVLDGSRTHGREYYDGVALGLAADVDGVLHDFGDGGVTRWAASLLGNSKLRCVVSCLSTQRVALLQ